jgi:hypothetical protein
VQRHTSELAQPGVHHKQPGVHECHCWLPFALAPHADPFPGASAPHWAGLALIVRSASLHNLRGSSTSALELELEAAQQEAGNPGAFANKGQGVSSRLLQLLSSLDETTKDGVQQSTCPTAWQPWVGQCTTALVPGCRSGGGYGLVESGDEETAAVVDALASAKVSYFLQV